MTKADIKPAKILIIDDNPSNLRLLTKILFEQGYGVRLAPSAKFYRVHINLLCFASEIFAP